MPLVAPLAVWAAEPLESTDERELPETLALSSGDTDGAALALDDALSLALPLTEVVARDVADALPHALVSAERDRVACPLAVSVAAALAVAKPLFCALTVAAPLAVTLALPLPLALADSVSRLGVGVPEPLGEPLGAPLPLATERDAAAEDERLATALPLPRAVADVLPVAD